MSKKVLACDMDEILFPFLDNFLDHISNKYGTKHSRKDFSSYEFEETLGLTFDETVRRVYEFNSMNCLHIDPIEDSVNAINKLADKYDLQIITARHPQHAETTSAWIRQKYGNVFGGIEFIGHPGAIENPKTKAEVCIEKGAIALIDDSHGHITKCAEHGIEAILFGDYPWNQARSLPDGVVRKVNWQEVISHFEV